MSANKLLIFGVLLLSFSCASVKDKVGLGNKKSFYNFHDQQLPKYSLQKFLMRGEKREGGGRSIASVESPNLKDQMRSTEFLYTGKLINQITLEKNTYLDFIFFSSEGDDMLLNNAMAWKSSPTKTFQKNAVKLLKKFNQNELAYLYNGTKKISMNCYKKLGFPKGKVLGDGEFGQYVKCVDATTTKTFPNVVRDFLSRKNIN
jgi:hypothetical protein